MKDHEDFLFKVCVALIVITFMLFVAFLSGCSSSASVVLSEVPNGV